MQRAHSPHVRRSRWASIALVASIALSGCGFKGPLYLPEDAPAKQAQP